MRKGFRCGLAASLLVCAPAAAGDGPQDWLERMSSAMNQMDYQGTFVYIQGTGEVETMRITHVVDEHGTRERLVSLSGVPREVVRHDGHVRWISGADHAVMADSEANRAIFPELPLDDPQQAAESYQFELREAERIAGHQGRRIDIVPRDEFRYGYSLWLEQHSGLLLRWKVTGEAGESLAQLMFTELRLGSQVNPRELGPSAMREADQHRDSGAVSGRSTAGNPNWTAHDLPPGFRLASHHHQSDAGSALEHLVYSDGIATVSVYIESTGETPLLNPGLSRLGTTHAFARADSGVAITVVGDVPARTVQRIGESVVPAGLTATGIRGRGP